LFRIGNCGNDKNDPATILTNYINQITLSDQTISMNGKTPEDQALKYLIETDKTFTATEILTLSSKTSNVVQFRISQRYALLTLFFQQTVDKQWADATGWLVNADECNSWFGISCASIDLGGTVGMQNVVTTVDFYGNNMKGTIPADLGLLTPLTYFDVSNNVLTGTLPSSVGQWTALTYFGAVNNKLTGTLPASIGEWTALKNFLVFNNALTGTLPASIGQWSTLTYFSIYKNALTGTIPASIVNWSQIQIAYFDLNQFTGSMPNGICPYITGNDRLEADCNSDITCSCCSICF
jgi:Leucine-rich repeat (LRR) protein